MTDQDHTFDFNTLNWEEMRTAYLVGELGTVSRAAMHTGVHRTTIMRHISSLERQLGRKIFDREHDGYSPTPFGSELIDVTRRVARDFHDFQLRGRTNETRIAGNIHIAAPPYLTCLVTSVLNRLQKQYTEFLYTFTPISEEEPDRFEDTDIILTAKDVVSEEYSTEKLISLQNCLFASNIYRDSIGLPKSVEELRDHKFACVCRSDQTSHAEDWLRQHVPARSIVFRSRSSFAVYTAISEGLAIGFLPTQIGLGEDNLIQVMEPSPAWEKDIWISVRHKTAEGNKTIAILNAFRDLAQRCGPDKGMSVN